LFTLSARIAGNESRFRRVEAGGVVAAIFVGLKDPRGKLLESARNGRVSVRVVRSTCQSEKVTTRLGAPAPAVFIRKTIASGFSSESEDNNPKGNNNLGRLTDFEWVLNPGEWDDPASSDHFKTGPGKRRNCETGEIE